MKNFKNPLTNLKQNLAQNPPFMVFLKYGGGLSDEFLQSMKTDSLYLSHIENKINMLSECEDKNLSEKNQARLLQTMETWSFQWQYMGLSRKSLLEIELNKIEEFNILGKIQTQDGDKLDQQLNKMLKLKISVSSWLSYCFYNSFLGIALLPKLKEHDVLSFSEKEKQIVEKLSLVIIKELKEYNGLNSENFDKNNNEVKSLYEKIDFYNKLNEELAENVVVSKTIKI